MKKPLFWRFLQATILTVAVLGVVVGASSFVHALVRPIVPHATAVTNDFQHAQTQIALVRTDEGSGTAFFVKRHNDEGRARWFAWTAAHVVDSNHTVDIVVTLKNEGKRVSEIVYEARLLALNHGWDLAVLHVEAMPDSFVPSQFGATAVVGAPVFAAGNFYGSRYQGSISTGVISQHDAVLGEWRQVDQSTCPIYPGSSGGPLFSTGGLVTGVVVARVDASLGFFVPVRGVQVFATELGIPWAVSGAHCPSDAQLTVMAKKHTVLMYGLPFF